MKSEGAKKMDTKKILESLTDMGCDEKEISFMKKRALSLWAAVLR